MTNSPNIRNPDYLTILQKYELIEKNRATIKHMPLSSLENLVRDLAKYDAPKALILNGIILDYVQNYLQSTQPWVSFELPDDQIQELFSGIRMNAKIPGQGNYSNFDELEKSEITKALKSTRGNVSQSSRILNITRDALNRRIKKYGLKPRLYKLAIMNNADGVD